MQCGTSELGTIRAFASEIIRLSKYITEDDNQANRTTVWVDALDEED